MDRKALRERQGRTPRERESSIFFLTGGGKRENKKRLFTRGVMPAAGQGGSRVKSVNPWVIGRLE